jgi:hypothetical protein
MSATKELAHQVWTPSKSTIFDLLKDCNIKLENLRTSEYRFVAWIIYSTQHKAYIAGVDTYSNDEENLQYVVTKAIGVDPGDVIESIHNTITKWHNLGEVPL